MDRRKNNQNSGKMHRHLRFEDADEVIKDAAESLNLDESMCDPPASLVAAALGMPFIDADDKTSADYYFDSYSYLGIHEEMLRYTIRTKTYQNVIYQNKFLFKSLVPDVGAGTGILSLFCAKVGAKHIYAVECSHMADMAKEIIGANGYNSLKGKN